jgi:hypothetical protein
MPSSNRLKYLDLQIRPRAPNVQFLHLKEKANVSRRLRKMLLKLRIAAALVVVCLSAALISEPKDALAQERPWSVSPCELLKKPGMYTETLVSVPGMVLVGPQEFTSHGYDCADEYGALRLEFGGNPTDPKDRFRLPMATLEAGTVPLKKDADYETMHRLMTSATASGQTKMLRATLRGRFFAGPAFGSKSGEIKYPNARFVISEVELVSNRLEDPVDFTRIAPVSAKPAKGCSVAEIAVPSRDDEDKLQRLSREPSENLEYLRDPRQVAARAIAEHERIAADDIASELHDSGEAVAVTTYTWASPDGLNTYTVTVNRPYWLLPSTYSGDTVIWVPKRIVKTMCAGKATR